ncbi:TATA element modulatory factor 1 TATA binding-domain-containing protein [Annulohypoxylon maeteangense]|uniref:TATA element modulatory factor 1 TATA binding-domain-containing protein n=1 Tax=Annulohypoxylon maeteangense TaxID=1927788 RepID=UPI0020088039|nr:TATA element modulatory factor 1 TATA binding-domain-containing protein [Annulohypoxylon maeteangense]KAI0882680.1 TATA element modulatory factor 1 TATA binding-domain-containing protein [Annulohypoxylon maeteangense]
MSNSQKSSRWGSFLSQAVAGVEARLDNILAEEESAKQTASQKPTRPSSASSTTTPNANIPTRSATPSRSTNDRLQERLARAVAAKNAAQRSDSSPVRPNNEIVSPIQSPRASSDILLRTSSEKAESSRDDTTDKEPSLVQLPAAASSGQVDRDVQVEGPQNAASEPDVVTSDSLLGSESILSSSVLYEERITNLEKSLEEAHAQHHEELHSHVEKVDALQAKLQYLARQASETARNAATTAPVGSEEKIIAEKDQQIAQLMEEGQKLANTEQKHRSIIKKLRGQLALDEKELNEQKLWRQKAENELAALRKRLNEQGDMEKANVESRRQISQLKRDLEKLRAEVASKDNMVSELKDRLQEESDQAQNLAGKVNDQLRQAGEQRVKELEDAVAALEVEKGLVADRAKIQVTELQGKADRVAERSRAVELELKGEIQILESKLEALRIRAEEASSGAVGDAQAKLLRQIETLQTQYSIASENWQGIEASLIAKTAVLEKERDEALRRESDMRRKARETATRAKRQEEELEEARNQLPNVQQDLTSYQSQLESLRRRAEEAEASLAEARSDFERQRLAWKEERAERTDQDRRNWLEDVPTAAFRSISRPESPLLAAPQRTFSGEFLGLQSYPTRLRKTSAPSSNGEPSPGDRPASGRRPSAQPPIRSPMFPVTSAQSGTPPSLPGGLEMLASPSTHPIDRDDVFDNSETPASPQNVLQDMVSVSTMTAGPSVQLVERMSAVVRRLESEKVAAKEELARISSQRDEARGEIVVLMKEAEAGKGARKRVEELEKEVADMNERYQTTLEMLGEKSELVEELRADVVDVKAMYRDLVERTIK